MTDRVQQITNNTIVPLSFGLLLALVIGVWNLAEKVSEFSNRLAHLEKSVSYRWTFLMEMESWNQVRMNNPDIIIPDVEKIRNIYTP